MDALGHAACGVEMGPAFRGSDEELAYGAPISGGACRTCPSART
jgi:hypothetical protein